MEKVAGTPRRSSRRRGVFLIIVVSGIFAFLGMAALISDMGYNYAERQRSQTVIDMAALTTLPALDTDSADLNGDALAMVQAVMTANAVDPATITTVSVELGNAGGSVTVDADLDVNALLGNLFGMSSYSVGVHSVATGELKISASGSLGSFGIFGCSDLEIGQGAFIDAYNSKDGNYEGPPDHPSPLSAQWSDQMVGDEGGYGVCSSSASGANGGLGNCSARVLVGSFGTSKISAGSDPFYLYGSVWSDQSVDVSVPNSLVDRDVLCAGCGISNSVTVHGAIDTSAPKANLSNCDFNELMPCDLFKDTDQAPNWIEADLETNHTPGDAVDCDGITYDYIIENGSWDIKTKNAVHTLNAGEIYHITEWNFAKEATVNIEGDIDTDGPPIVFIDGAGKGLDWNKEVTIQFNGATCGGSVVTGGSKGCHAMYLYASPGTTLLNLKKAQDGVEMILDIVAPDADIDVDKDMGLNGRVVGNDVNIKKDATFTYDESLGGDFGVFPPAGFQNVRLHE